MESDIKVIDDEAEKFVNVFLLKHPEYEDNEAIELSLRDFSYEIVKFNKGMKNRLTDGVKIQIQTEYPDQPEPKNQGFNPARLGEGTR